MRNSNSFIDKIDCNYYLGNITYDPRKPICGEIRYRKLYNF